MSAARRLARGPATAACRPAGLAAAASTALASPRLPLPPPCTGSTNGRIAYAQLADAQIAAPTCASSQATHPPWMPTPPGLPTAAAWSSPARAAESGTCGPWRPTAAASAPSPAAR
jgi:hypothetical protein